MPCRCEPTCVFWRMCKYWQRRISSKCGMPLTRSMPSSLNMVCFHVLWSGDGSADVRFGFICGSLHFRLPPVRAAWRDSCRCVCVCVHACKSVCVGVRGCVKYPNCDSPVSVDPPYLDMPTLFVSHITLTHRSTPFLLSRRSFMPFSFFQL